MDELTCPYCENVQQTHEPDEISSMMCLETCESCGKQFWYSVEVKRTYESREYDENLQ